MKGINLENLPTVLVGVIGGFIFIKLLAAYLHTKLQERFHQKDHSYEDFDKVVEARKLLFKKHEKTFTQSSSKKGNDPEQLKEPDDPEYLKKKSILELVYQFETRAKPQESELQFFRRILTLKEHYDESDLKQSYRKLIQIYHPDKIDLKDFDKKTKSKLEKRIHENFTLLKKAHDRLKNELD
jgi:hypothetical protein